MMDCKCKKEPRKVRIGKNIGIKWNILTAEGEKLEDIDLCFEMTDPKGNKTLITNFEIIGDNDVEFGLDGRMFKYLGLYHLTAWRNKGENGQTMTDKTAAFELVRWTDDENNQTI